MNKLSWFRQIAMGLLIPLTLSAQALADYSVPESAAPAEVVKALRERVTEFFGYHIGPVNRKAIDLVAEDTKDYYFGSGKVQFLGVAIMGVDFTKDLQRASVRLETTQNWQVQQYTTVATTPVVTSWKMEDGKWVWFLDNQALIQATTPMGATRPPPPAIDSLAVPDKILNADGTLNLPKDFAAPERVAAQGMAIIKQGGLDKDSVTLTLGKAGEDKVTFVNGYGGQVSLNLYEAPKVPGLTITLNKKDLLANENGVVSFVYTPPADAAPAPTGRQYTLRLNVVPFNLELPIKLTLIGPQ